MTTLSWSAPTTVSTISPRRRRSFGGNELQLLQHCNRVRGRMVEARASRPFSSSAAGRGRPALHASLLLRENDGRVRIRLVLIHHQKILYGADRILDGRTT